MPSRRCANPRALQSQNRLPLRAGAGRKPYMPRVRWIAAAIVCALAATPCLAAGRLAGFPDFNPDGGTAWSIDRPAADDFLPPDHGPGPVLADPRHPYVPNGPGRQSTYRVADLTNPILKPWVVTQMKKTNDEVLAGKVPFIARERCWPGGVPGMDIYNRGQPLHFLQTPTEVLLVNELYASTRHVYMNVAHSQNPKPSWYGESVGHYEGDTLVVDTIGLSPKAVIDNYHTPHTDKLHVIERYHMIDGGKQLEADLTVDDPGTFYQPWQAMQHYTRVRNRPMLEENCSENNDNTFHLPGWVGAPTANKPDF